MYIATALYQELSVEVMDIKQDINLSTNERVGFFPVFNTKEQAKNFAKQMLEAQGVEVHIVNVFDLKPLKE